MRRRPAPPSDGSATWVPLPGGPPGDNFSDLLCFLTLPSHRPVQQFSTIWGRMDCSGLSHNYQLPNIIQLFCPLNTCFPIHYQRERSTSPRSSQTATPAPQPPLRSLRFHPLDSLPGAVVSDKPRPTSRTNLQLPGHRSGKVTSSSALVDRIKAKCHLVETGMFVGLVFVDNGSRAIHPKATIRVQDDLSENIT